LHLGFAGGGMAVIDYAETLPPGDGYFSLSLIGSTGAAYADDHHNMQLLYGGGHPSALHTGEADLSALAQLQEFLNAVEQNREPLITGADGLRAVEVAEAAAVSLATREGIQIPR
jgi:predicted dehydrogenase